MTDSTDSPVTLVRRGDVALILVDDGKANAINMPMIEGLLAAFDEAADAKAVVLAGRPGRFSAGFDLKEIQAGNVVEMFTRGADVLFRIVDYPRPFVIAATGHAMAMGAVLLMAADWRVGAAGDFKVGLNEVRIGLPLPKFATRLAEYRLSRNHLTAATQLAEIYDPLSAVSVGFLDELAEPDDVIATAVERADAWGAALDPEAFGKTRTNMRKQLVASLRDAVASGE